MSTHHHTSPFPYTDRSYPECTTSHAHPDALATPSISINPILESIRILTPPLIHNRRPTRPTQRKIQHLTLHPRIHKLPQTPPNLHCREPLLPQRINLLPLYENNLIQAVFPVIDFV